MHCYAVEACIYLFIVGKGLINWWCCFIRFNFVSVWLVCCLKPHHLKQICCVHLTHCRTGTPLRIVTLIAGPSNKAAAAPPRHCFRMPLLSDGSSAMVGPKGGCSAIMSGMCHKALVAATTQH